jgi:hypothetical protein
MASDNGKAGARDAKEVRYSLIYVIHGDGEYVYHDSVGDPHGADEEALSGALLVGERSADAEVFIFHQKPKRRFLFFGADDGDFWYFRHGQPLVKQTYSRDDPDFQEELRLFRQYTVGGEKTFFLYYGHEIPEAGGESYDESGTGRVFNIASLGRALEGFSKAVHSSSHSLDLVVLSTCFNGSPCAISRLAPYTQFIIASPEYLHLSYMQNRLFESLNSLNDLSTAEIARRFASLSFERLKKQTETAITVVVYDTRKITPFLNGTAAQCDSLVGLLNTDAEMATIHYYDWLDIPGLFRKGAEEGVTVFYQPPEFGRMQKKKHHSGWEGWSVSSEELRVKSEEGKVKNEE